ncbi:DUF1707 SHOCT-like domain-containing protein [Actinomadura atramentaria]|uniref:DUF1707 SHOCT-like domain-containing protein n=1 Tax=Actinomadura atramentaria TaxID=1990 RepID=UPI000379964B|nr:DUF1707 domain-containing protein [Actinomadura atramentaria]
MPTDSPQQANVPDPPAARASDADRDRIVELLNAAVTDGRLDPAEFDERVGAALTARTVDALAPLVADLSAVPGGAPGPAPGVLRIREKYGTVRRAGRWTLPRRLVVRTKWSGVTLDLTRAVRTGPELAVELKVQGGGVDLILAPGMTVDAGDVSAHYGAVLVSDDEPEASEVLRVRLTGRVKFAALNVTWRSPDR